MSSEDLQIVFSEFVFLFKICDDKMLGYFHSLEFAWLFQMTEYGDICSDKNYTCCHN